MACIGSIIWDYFDNEDEAKEWHYNLSKKDNTVKYIGEKKGKFIVQRAEESPFAIMNRIPKKRNIF